VQLLLGWCVRVSDTGVAQLAACCPLLAVLSVRACPKVTDASVVKLAQVQQKSRAGLLKSL
jgi:F-box and leucine-rich repeat protein GRR1